MKQLIHSGILIPKYEALGFRIKFKGEIIQLTPKQEEMAVAFVKKLGTEYVEDPVFVKNFFGDFCQALGIKGTREDFDFSEIENHVRSERETRERMGKEEKKRLAEERKVIRDANKEKYGKAIVDGQAVEVGNYMAEPSSIFMGRGKHPLRGKWKDGATEKDIILNLSPDAPIPESFLEVANHCQLARFISSYSHCNSGADILSHLTKLHGKKNITSKNMEKLKTIQNFMRIFLKNTECGEELIEVLQESLGESGLKNSKEIPKDTQNINRKKQNRSEYIDQSSLGNVLTILEKLTLSKNTEGNVNSVETAISEFLSFITESHLKENYQNSAKELAIGEILEKEKICKYCVVIATGLFTCLNISINMPWKEVVWAQNLWTAKWDDKLRGREKYIWLADTSPVKQEREMEKFDKAVELGKKYAKLKQYIKDNLNSTDQKVRKVATVCYLIDEFQMRVGDEKDEDEADTCIPFGEFILGEEHKPVQTFKVGDFILDGNGNFTSITKLFKRPYVGQIVKIHGCGLFPFSLTGNHSVLVAQRVGSKGDTFSFNAIGFKPAKELISDLDYLVFSKLKTNTKDYEMDLTQHPMLIKRPGPQKIRLDEKLAEFFGIYLAEGCATIEQPGKNRHEGRIVLTFGLKEIDLARRVASIANDLFYRKVRVLKEGSCIRVIFFSLQLARFLRQNFGKRARLKTIPPFMMKAPDHIVKAFIKAYFAGDACLRTEKRHGKYICQRFVLTTSSRTLALQLQKLLSKIGIFAPISIKSGKATKTILGRKVRAHQAYHVSVIGKAMEKLEFACSSQRFRPRHYDTGGYFYVPIKKIEKVPYSGAVFNFKTMNGLFEVSNVTVHNCGATTLSTKNIEIEGNLVKFDFLGKDSVRWQKEAELPENVVKNLSEFISQSDSLIFDGIRSEHVNDFLSAVVPGISAKVFRTFHASKIVDDYLKKEKVTTGDPEDYKKYVATMANLQAAIVCNHKRKMPKNWKERLQKKMDSIKQVKLKKGKKTAERVKTMKLKLELMKETRDYNLNTSLKSYVDPRVYYRWSKKVDFDWKKYYPKTLQRKFSWVEKQ